MALSEREQELLAQLEKQLNDDPNFAASMPSGASEGTTAPAAPIAGRNLVIGLLIAVLGLGVLIAGVSTKMTILGVLGFVIAAGGVYYCTLRPKNAAPAPTRAAASGATKTKPTSSFMRNLEDKWDERQGGNR